MTRQQVFALCFLGLFLFLLYHLVIIFRPFIIPILWAAIIARLAFPLNVRLTRLLRGRRSVSAGLLTLLILIIAIIPLVYLTFVLVEETGAAYYSFSEWVHRGGVSRVTQYLSRLPVVGGKVQELAGRAVVGGNLEGSLLEGGKTVSMFLLTHAADMAKNAFEFTLAFLVMIFTLFFFFKDGERLYRGLYGLIPLSETHKEKFFSRLDRTMTAVVHGTILTAIAQGILAGIAYWFLGVPFPMVLTALSAFLALLPYGGTALIWVPVAGYLLWAGIVWKAVAMALWGGIVVVALPDNFLKPLLIGHGAALPTLFLFFSILGGLAAYGFIGLLLGPILLAIVIAAIEIYQEEYPEEVGPKTSRRHS
jgi:predicted PurR-regulated permease PerM